MQTPKNTAWLVEAITALIANGELKPGERLDEVTIANRFEVSRTPIREAINQLLGRGILMRRKGRGVQVTEVSHAELAEMYEAMSEIEALCARMAAHRISWLLRTELEKAHQDCIDAANANDRDAFLRANEVFHSVIYRSTQNKHIERLATEFRRNTAPFRARRFQAEDDLRRAVEGHQRILAAVTGANSEQAYADMRLHITEQGKQALAAESV